MGYLNTSSGLSSLLSALGGELDTANQNNQQLRGLVAGGVLPQAAGPAPDFLTRVQQALMPASVPQAQNPLPAPVAASASAAPTAPPMAPMSFMGANAPTTGGAPPAPPARAPGYAAAPAGPTPIFAASQGVPGSISPNAQQALAFYQSKGLSPLAASALVGGFTAESSHGLNTQALNRGDGSDGSNSIGIAQWNGSRAAALQQFAQANGLDPRDLNTQLQFSWAELNGPEKGTLAALQAAQNPGQATAAALGYERPAGWTAANPYGAKTFGQRLGATVELSNAAGGSPYGTLSAGSAADTSALPTMAASGMGASLPNATGFAPRAPQGGSMVASSTGQPVPVDAQGNVLGYAPPGTAAAAPASRAIASAAPVADADDQPVSVPGFKGTWTRASAAATEADDSPEVDQVAAAQKTGQQAPAAQAPVAASAPPAPPSAPPSTPAGVPAQPTLPQIQALIQNPATRNLGLQLWQASIAPKAPIVAHAGDTFLNPTTLQPMAAIPQAQNLQHFAGKDGSEYAFDPRTGQTTKLSDGGPGTTVIPNDQAAARGMVPAGFTGVVQQDSDGKVTISAPPQGQSNRPQLVDVPMGDGTVQKQWITPGQAGGAAVGSPYSPAKNAGIMGPTEQKIFNDHFDKVEALAQGLKALQDARVLSDQTPTGWAATGEKAANWLTGGNAFQSDVANANTYDAQIKLASTALMRAAIGGRVTNYDEKIAQDIAPTSSMSVTSRNQILDKQIAEKQRDLAVAQNTVEAMRNGSYFAKGPNAARMQGQAAIQQPSAPTAPAQGYTPATSASDALGQARAAIQAGADPAAVKLRLQQHGIDPGQL